MPTVGSVGATDTEQDSTIVTVTLQLIDKSLAFPGTI